MILKKMMVCIAAVCCCGGVLGVGETLVPVFPPAGKISVLPGTAPEQVEFPPKNSTVWRCGLIQEL